MRRKKRSKKSLGNPMLLIASIALLNLTGVSYAALNDSPAFTTSVSTGEIDPQFSSALQAEIFDNYHSISIQRDLTLPEHEISTSFGILNKGSVPVKLIDYKISSDSGLTINENFEDQLKEEVIKPADDDPYKGELELAATEPGTYNFEIELLFSQWNKKP